MLAVVAACVFVFAQVRGHDFINLDDPQYVRENPQLSGGLTWPAVRWAFTTAYAANWHPLTWLSHLLDVQLWGLAPGPHHLVNALLHTANALLLFALLRRMTGALGRSALVALLFAVHPLHVESVAWVAERKDVLSAFFGLLTVWAYLAYLRRPGAGRHAAVLVLFALGLMAKPMLVTLPFLLLLLDLWPLGRVSFGEQPPRPGAAATSRASWPQLLREKLPLLALSLASSLVTFVVQQRGGAVKGLDLLPLDRRLANAVLAYLAYLGKALWPTRLSVLYPYPAPPSAWHVVGPAAALLAVSVLVVRSARRRPYLFVGWFWYLGMLLPVIGLIQVGSQPMADRYTYLPLIGIFIIVSWGVPDLMARWPRLGAFLPVAAAVVVLACAVAAREQVRHWQDSVALWEHTLRVTVGNYRAHNNLGQALARQGRTAEAVGHYSDALRLNPDFGEAHANLGQALAELGRVGEAIAQLNEALRLLPDDVDAHNNLGVALVGEGRLEEATRHFSEALRVKPDLAVSHLNLGVALAKQGRHEEAIRHLSEAVRIAPGDAKARTNLGLALAGRGQLGDAVAHYLEALRLDPGSAEAHNGLGNALVGLDRPSEAADHYQQALRLRPDLAEAHNGLGVALAAQGQRAEAVAHYAEAVHLAPNFAEAHSNLGSALAGLGRVEEAIGEFREAVRVRPDEPDFRYDLAVMLSRTGRLAEARQHLEAALKLDPAHRAARTALDQLSRRSGGSAGQAQP